MFPTPFMEHLSADDYNDVYEPVEDSYLCLDALESQIDFINNLKPLCSIEIGSGSGIISAFLVKMLQNNVFHICVDINLKAIEATKKTASRNGVIVNCITADMFSAVSTRLAKSFDIVVFNPPYVVTEPSELGSRGIEASYAGGIRGRQVIDRYLDEIDNILSAKGAAYLAVIQQNDIDDITEVMASRGFLTQTVISRKTSIEHLSILKFTRIEFNLSQNQEA